MVTTQISYAKIFLSDIRTQVWNYTNPSGTPITLNIGTVMGLIFATASACRDCQSGSSDGSQIPYGHLLQTITVAGNATVLVTLVVSGVVVDSLMVFSNGTDTLNTAVVDGGVTLGTMRSLLTKGGIWPTPSTENTFGDN